MPHPSQSWKGNGILNSPFQVKTDINSLFKTKVAGLTINSAKCYLKFQVEDYQQYRLKCILYNGSIYWTVMMINLKLISSPSNWVLFLDNSIPYLILAIEIYFLRVLYSGIPIFTKLRQIWNHLRDDIETCHDFPVPIIKFCFVLTSLNLWFRKPWRHNLISKTEISFVKIKCFSIHVRIEKGEICKQHEIAKNELCHRKINY